MSANSVYPAEVYGAIDKMWAVANAEPADQLWVRSLMELAQLLVELEPQLRDDQVSILIAIGALMMPLALAESQAGQDAKALLERLRVATRG